MGLVNLAFGELNANTGEHMNVYKAICDEFPDISIFAINKIWGAAFTEGEKEGYKNGHEAGYKEGYEKGYKSGQNDGESRAYNDHYGHDMGR